MQAESMQNFLELELTSTAATRELSAMQFTSRENFLDIVNLASSTGSIIFRVFTAMERNLSWSGRAGQGEAGRRVKGRMQERDTTRGDEDVEGGGESGLETAKLTLEATAQQAKISLYPYLTFTALALPLLLPAWQCLKGFVGPSGTLKKATMVILRERGGSPGQSL